MYGNYDMRVNKKPQERLILYTGFFFSVGGDVLYFVRNIKPKLHIFGCAFKFFLKTRCKYALLIPERHTHIISSNKTGH